LNICFFCESALRKLVKPKRMCWDESPLGWRYPCVGEITKVLKNDTPRITRPLTTTYLHWCYRSSVVPNVYSSSMCLTI